MSNEPLHCDLDQTGICNGYVFEEDASIFELPMLPSLPDRAPELDVEE